MTPGVAISIINSKREYLEPTAAVSGKTSKKEFSQLERQVVLELLALSEVLRADGAVVMLKGNIKFLTNVCIYACLASRYSFRPYVYVRPADVLLKFPKFNYRSISVNHLSDTVNGLIVIFSLLQLECCEFYKAFPTHQLHIKVIHAITVNTIKLIVFVMFNHIS